MRIQGTITFEDGREHEFMISTESTSAWNQWGANATREQFGLTVPVMDALSAALCSSVAEEGLDNDQDDDEEEGQEEV